MALAPPRLEAHALSKSFGASRALDEVSMALAPGEIRGLIGQNGSGKSTLIKVLSGFHRGASGDLLVDGHRIGPPTSPELLRDRGVSFVHQDLGLVDTVSVADNVRVGRFRVGRLSRNIDDRAERDATVATLRRLRSQVSPSSPVGRLVAADRAVVAIARALQGHEPGQGLVVFDESTRALPRETLDEFYALVREMAAEGTTILLVSHRLDEVLHLTDRVTVLRDGRLAGDVATADTSEAELSRMMLGFDADRDPMQDAITSQLRGRVLEATAVAGRLCRGVEFTAEAGEVVGVIGPTDSGYEELPYLLSGSTAGTGRLRVDGTLLELGRAPLARFLSSGVVLVPGERAAEGLALQLSVLENLTLPWVRTRSAPISLQPKWQHDAFELMAGSLGIVPRRSDVLVSQLSGGNQQKVLLGKWLLGAPKVLIAHEPTQAVDVGARRDILAALRRAAQAGAAIVVVSNEAEDLATACDRILVMRHGVVVAELRAPVQVDDVLAAAYPTVQARGGAS